MNGNARLVDAGAPYEARTARDDARKRAIARAVWTEVHWLMPRDRTVIVTVDGDDIAVELGPVGPPPSLSP